MKRMIVSTLVAMIAVAILAFLMTPAMSQDKPADNMEIVREKIKADKKLFVAANMQLTDGEAKFFWPVYEDYQKALEKLDSLTIKLIEDYARNYQSLSDMAAKKIVDDHLAIELERGKLMQSYLPRLRQALSEKKVARYYQLENKIRAVVDFELARSIPLVK